MAKMPLIFGFFVIENYDSVYFWSPSIALFNVNRTTSINDQNLLIYFNWEVTPIFALKGSAYRHQSKFRVLVCLVLWRNHRSTLSVDFTKIE